MPTQKLLTFGNSFVSFLYIENAAKQPENSGVLKDTALWLIIAVPFVLYLLITFIKNAVDIRDELKYINVEIARTYGAEQKHWKKKKRHLIHTVFSLKSKHY